MPRFIVTTLVALLLASACCHHKKPCPSRPCQQATPARCTPQAKPYERKVGSNRHPVTLSRVTDYLPGLPPSYLSI